MAEGIRIPKHIAEREGVPDDLNVEEVGTHDLPDPSLRRVAGWIYVALAVGLAWMALKYEPRWWVAMTIVLGMSFWHFASAWPLEIRQESALREAAQRVPFAIGHASAAVTFHGFRARPRWHVVLYSAEEPPSRRGLVVLDAITGHQIGDTYVEELSEI